MSEEKKDFRSDRFTWKEGELEKEDKLPDDLTNKFSTYYEDKAAEAQKEDKKKES